MTENWKQRLEWKQRTAQAAQRLLLVIAAIALLTVMSGHQAAAATGPFAPTFSVTLSDSSPGARATVTTTHSVPTGNELIDSLTVFVPLQWQIASGSSYSVGEVVGRVAVHVAQKDSSGNCTGSDANLAPGDLVNDALDPEYPDWADWVATVGGTWELSFAVNNADTEWQIDVFLNNASMPSNLCSPEQFQVTIFGTSSPTGAMVIANPVSAGTYTWNDGLIDVTHSHVAFLSANVCVGSTCADTDGDGIPDASDNCPTVSNASQADWNHNGVGDACEDSDSDSLGLTRVEPGGACPTSGTAQPFFRDCIEVFLGTDPGVQCASNAWPPDFNGDLRINVTDRTLLTRAVSNFNATPSVYDKRFDLNADGAINITDRSILIRSLDASGNACPAPDMDGDGIPDASDNCPTVSNPSQADWNHNGVGDACEDSDSDSLGLTRVEPGGACPTSGTAQAFFGDCIEVFLGTDPGVQCASNAWPPDFNGDLRINVTDRTLLTRAVSNFNATPSVYDKRFDLNADGAINITDRSILILSLDASSGAAPCP